MKFILGSDSISVFLDGKMFPVNKTSKTYDIVLKAVRTNDEKLLRQALSMKTVMEQKLKNVTAVTIDGSKVLFEGREITGLIKTRIFEMLSIGLDIKPISLFLENLMQNPSKRAVDELFGFMEACNLPITEDGCFLAYKRVRHDYLDCHSATMDNSVGNVLSMPRNAVDEDKNRTCSAGLHFCSYDYLQHFHGARIVVLKINPRDVVAIPADYNNAKGRTCRYEVIDELPLNEYNLPQYEIQENFTSDYEGVSEAVESNSPIGKTSLSDETVAFIKEDIGDGMTIAAIARKYGTSSRTVARIRDDEVEAYKNI